MCVYEEMNELVITFVDFADNECDVRLCECEEDDRCANDPGYSPSLRGAAEV